MNLIFIQDCRKIAPVLMLSGKRKGGKTSDPTKYEAVNSAKKSLEFSRLGRSRALDLSLGASRPAMKGHECDVATDKDNPEMAMKIGENLLVLSAPPKKCKIALENSKEKVAIRTLV